jgi:hypothetical protein
LNWLNKVNCLLKAGFVHVVDAELKGYFDSIPHDFVILCRSREEAATALERAQELVTRNGLSLHPT